MHESRCNSKTLVNWKMIVFSHFKNPANQKQELPVVAMFVNGSGLNEHSL
jgi:hypothetical protein